MSCDQVRQDLVAYLNDELPAQNMQSIAAHLTACPACAEEASTLRQMCQRLTEGLRTWVEQGGCPPEVERQIRWALQAEAEADRMHARTITWRTIGTAAAAVAAAVLLVTITPVGGLIRNITASVGQTEVVGNPRAEVRPVGQSLTMNGISVEVNEVQFTAQETRVLYEVENAGGVSVDELQAVQLFAGGAPLTLISSPMVKPASGGAVQITATFGAAQAGQPVTLRIERIGGAHGPWIFELPQRMQSGK